MPNTFQISSTLRCDVLIIGAGGAGLRCAAEVLEKRPGSKVLAITKVANPQKSHTQTAQGGMAAVDPKDQFDSETFHAFDTWKGSDCSADQNIIQKIVSSAWDQIIWLENRGMHFSRNEAGQVAKRTFGGHTFNFGEASAFRAVFEADRTGKGIMDTVWGEALKGGVSFLNQAIVTELLIKDDRCAGAVLFMQKEGEFVSVLARATVLATGGNGQVFKVTTNCRQNTGDCNAIILKAGLPVMDPEAIQFHPTGIVGPGILASETLRSVGGILRNRDMERFMEGYAPKMKELAPRDLVARAIETEIREDRGIVNPDHSIPHVWIDLRHLSDYIHDKQIPEVSSFFKKFLNIDSKNDLCPVRPSNHYQMGGIPTDEYGQVQKNPTESIAGLFAIGECAAASFHGFNRLGTNSLLELITVGQFAGEKIVEKYLSEELDEMGTAGDESFFQFAQYLEQSDTDNIGQIREAMRTLMTEKVGVFRTEKSIGLAIGELQELKKRADKIALTSKSLAMNQELVQRWELENLLLNALAIAKGALNRKESRGAHFREDFPQRDDRYNYHTLVYMPDFNQVRFAKRNIDMSLFEAKKTNFEKFGMIERKY